MGTDSVIKGLRDFVLQLTAMGLKQEQKGLIEKYIDGVSENDIYNRFLHEYWMENGDKLDLPGSEAEVLGFRRELFDSNDDQPHGKLRKMMSFVQELQIKSGGGR